MTRNRLQNRFKLSTIKMMGKRQIRFLAQHLDTMALKVLW